MKLSRQLLLLAGFVIARSSAVRIELFADEEGECGSEAIITCGTWRSSTPRGQCCGDPNYLISGMWALYLESGEKLFRYAAGLERRGWESCSYYAHDSTTEDMECLVTDAENGSALRDEELGGAAWGYEEDNPLEIKRDVEPIRQPRIRSSLNVTGPYKRPAVYAYEKNTAWPCWRLDINSDAMWDEYTSLKRPFKDMAERAAFIKKLGAQPYKSYAEAARIDD